MHELNDFSRSSLAARVRLDTASASGEAADALAGASATTANTSAAMARLTMG